MSDQPNPLPPPSFDPPQPQPSEQAEITQVQVPQVQVPQVEEHSPEFVPEPTAVMPTVPDGTQPITELVEVAAEPAADAPVVAVAPPIVVRRGGVVPWVITVVALAAAGTFAFLWVTKSSDADDAKKATAAATAAGNAATAQVTALTGQVTDLQTQLTDVQSKLTEAQTQAADAEAKVVDLQTQLDAVANNDQAAADKLATAQTQIEDLTRSNAELQAQLDAANATIAAVAPVKTAVDFSPATSLGIGRRLFPTATTLTDDQARCIGGLYLDLAGFDSVFGGVAQGGAVAPADKAVLEQVVAQAPDACSVDAAVLVI